MRLINRDLLLKIYEKTCTNPLMWWLFDLASSVIPFEWYLEIHVIDVSNFAGEVLWKTWGTTHSAWASQPLGWFTSEFQGGEGSAELSPQGCELSVSHHGRWWNFTYLFYFSPRNPGEKGPNLTNCHIFSNGVGLKPPNRIRMTYDLFKKSFFRRRFRNRHLHLFTGILGGPTRSLTHIQRS